MPHRDPSTFRLLDHQLALRPAWTWHLTVYFLLWPIAYGFGLISARLATNQTVPLWLFSHWQQLALFATLALPAAITLLTLGRRRPGAHVVVRWWWRRQRSWLTLTATLQLGALLLWQLQTGAKPTTTTAVATMVLHGYALWYCLRSRFLRQLANSFPD